MIILSDLERRTLLTVTSTPTGRLEFEEKAAMYRFARLGLCSPGGVKRTECVPLTEAGRQALGICTCESQNAWVSGHAMAGCPTHRMLARKEVQS